MGLHAKLAEVMAEADRIPKKGKAPAAMGGFEFVQVGDAADAIRKALGSRGISMLPSGVEVLDSTEHETRSGGTMTTVTVRSTWTLVDGESGETAQIQSLGTGADTGDKYSPKAQTNAMKYALLMGFLLSTGDDPEQTDTSDRRAPVQRTEVYTAQHRPPPREAPGAKTFTGKAVTWNQPGLDGEVRLDPEDVPQYGFVLECEDGKKRHVRISGDLASTTATANPIGERVTVSGRYRVEDLPTKDGRTYKAGVIYADAVVIEDAAEEPAPLDAEAERELDAIAI